MEAQCPLTDAPQTTQRLLDVGDTRAQNGVSVEMVQLQPAWMSIADDAKRDLKAIQSHIVRLRKFQEKRLVSVFADEKRPDKEVEATSVQIATIFRQCEQRIHQVKTIAADSESAENEIKFRQNVQRCLATQLKELQQQFTQAQKQYVHEIRQRSQVWDDGPDACGGGARSSSDSGRNNNAGFNDDQMLELESMEVNASQRSEEIIQIASSISDLNSIFKELAVLVIDQGTILDRIDFNIEQVVVTSKDANEQLRKAEKSQKSNRAMKCILLLLAVNLLLIIILIVKARQ